MTTLRQRMIEDMCIRNFASTTQLSALARSFHTLLAKSDPSPRYVLVLDSWAETRRRPVDTLWPAILDTFSATLHSYVQPWAPKDVTGQPARMM
jgi:hypothetical protein